MSLVLNLSNAHGSLSDFLFELTAQQSGKGVCPIQGKQKLQTKIIKPSACLNLQCIQSICNMRVKFVILRNLVDCRLMNICLQQIFCLVPSGDKRPCYVDNVLRTELVNAPGHLPRKHLKQRGRFVSNGCKRPQQVAKALWVQLVSLPHHLVRERFKQFGRSMTSSGKCPCCIAERLGIEVMYGPHCLSCKIFEQIEIHVPSFGKCPRYVRNLLCIALLCMHHAC
mmetsp:Transcript_134550/g.245566  ORF Transcript_134550/g.245566 Transcript_134550/m.245566 type:complete len:225 (+) Transcript_134550:1263-1937(+)